MRNKKQDGGKTVKKSNTGDLGQMAHLTMAFTETELETLGNGILSLIEKTGQAKAFVPDEKVHMTIDEYCTRLQALNNKICRCR